MLVYILQLQVGTAQLCTLTYVTIVLYYITHHTLSVWLHIGIGQDVDLHVYIVGNYCTAIMVYMLVYIVFYCTPSPLILPFVLFSAGQSFIRHNSVVLVHGYSRVVASLLSKAAETGRMFRVLCTHGHPHADG